MNTQELETEICRKRIALAKLRPYSDSWYLQLGHIAALTRDWRSGNKLSSVR